MSKSDVSAPAVPVPAAPAPAAPTSPAVPARSEGSIKIPIAKIRIDHKFNARSKTSQEKLGKFSETLKREGQLTPIHVAPGKVKGSYDLIAGFRRTEAAKLLGWEEIEAKIVEPPTEIDRRMLNLIENVEREDLLPFELAEASYGLSQLGLTGSQIAARLGLSKPHVNNLIRCREKLHPDLWAAMCVVREGARDGGGTSLAWFIACAGLSHEIQQEKWKEKLGEGGSGGSDTPPGETKPAGKKGPSKRIVEEYMSSLRAIPKKDRDEAWSWVYNTLRWRTGELAKPPIKIPEAEEE